MPHDVLVKLLYSSPSPSPSPPPPPSHTCKCNGLHTALIFKAHIFGGVSTRSIEITSANSLVTKLTFYRINLGVPICM